MEEITIATISPYESSDYAGVSAGKYSFYYGYEYGRTQDDEEQWGFEVQVNSERVYGITVEEMQERAKFDRTNCQQALLAGIALWIQEKQKRDDGLE